MSFNNYGQLRNIGLYAPESIDGLFWHWMRR